MQEMIYPEGRRNGTWRARLRADAILLAVIAVVLVGEFLLCGALQ